MNTATEALVIINSVVFTVFLIMAIILFIKINNIFKKIDTIVDKADNFVTSAEKFGSKLEKVASMATYTTMFKNLVGSIFNK